MTKHHRDPRLCLLGSVPTQDDIHIVASKLPINKQVLLAFIAKKEEFDQTKNKKPMFKAAMSITTEQILLIYARARILTKQTKKVAQDIVQHYRSMQNLMKIIKKKEDQGEPKKGLKHSRNVCKKPRLLDERCMEQVIQHRRQASLLSRQNDRTASVAEKGINTHRLEMREQKKMEDQVRLERAEEIRKNEEATVAMLVNSFDDQLSSQLFAPKDAGDCDEKALCFWFGRILLC